MYDIGDQHERMIADVHRNDRAFSNKLGCVWISMKGQDQWLLPLTLKPELVIVRDL